MGRRLFKYCKFFSGFISHFFISHAAAQQNKLNLDNLLIDLVFVDNNKEIFFIKSNFSFEINASALPKAKITRETGNYRLQSRLQSAYEAGINYVYNVNKNISITSGLHGIIGKWNFFANIPSEDLSQYNVDGRSIIWDKELWGAVRIPVLIAKKIKTKRKDLISLDAGFTLSYNGFVQDLFVGGGGIIDSNNQVISIFSAFFSENNNYKPWVTFLARVSRLFVLDNQNILSLGLKTDISSIYFFKGSYTISIPNHPNTSGTYKISGTSLGLSVQYIFTGANKRLIQSYQKSDL